MPNLSLKIAYPIIIVGLFVIASFVAFNYQNLTTTFYVAFFLLVAHVFLFGFATGQNFAAPIKRLLQKANDLSKGNFSSRFYAEGKDEIAQLAVAFNRIAERLEESNDENERTKKSVGIKVEAETQSLKEVINALEQKVQNRTLELQKIMGDLDKFQQHSKEQEEEILSLRDQVNKIDKKAVNSKANTKV